MSNINALRATLFDTLRKLQDKDNPLDVERAKAINETAQVIINTAKIEVDYCRATGQAIASGFLPTGTVLGQKTTTGVKTVTEVPGATITRHRLT